MQSAILWTAALSLAVIETTSAVITIGYEDVDLGINGYINNSAYAKAGVTHSNSFTDWGGGSTSWDGFAISNHTDKNTAGFGNQYSSYSGDGASGSAQYAIGYLGFSGPTRLTFANATNMLGLGAAFNNTTYAGISMRDGDDFAKKFGGLDGTDPDFLLLTLSGYNGGVAQGSIDFYLADFRGEPSSDYIVNQWTDVDFSPLGTVDEIRFSMSSSDNSDWGFGPSMNTPSYFAMDNLSVPEPGSIMFVVSGLGLWIRRRR